MPGIGWGWGNHTQQATCLIRLLILTGARREEITALKWSEITGDIIALGSARTKNAEPHTIPLSLPATSLLQRVPCIAGSSLVFTTNGNSSVSGYFSRQASSIWRS